MKRTAAFGLLIVALLISPTIRAGGNKLNFEGTWIPKSVTLDGKKSKPEDNKGVQLIIAKNNYTIKNKGKVTVSGTFVVDVKKKPITIDIVQKAAKGKDIKMSGILQMKGDTMTVCASEQGKARPKDFTCKKGSGRMLVVYMRKKK